MTHLSKTEYFPNVAMQNIELPQPDTFDYSVITKGYSSYRTEKLRNIVTPYQNLYWKPIAQKYQLVIPFDRIITKDMGNSVCQLCNAKYAGYQHNCDRNVRVAIAKLDEYGDKERFVSEVLEIGSRIQRSGHWHIPVITSISNELCGGALQWDLDKEFVSQQNFFAFLEYLGRYTGPEGFQLGSWKDAIPFAALDVAQKSITEGRVTALEHRNVQLEQALKMIAEKMNAAGNNLSFGF